mgnify:CR=1 FL=1
MFGLPFLTYTYATLWQSVADELSFLVAFFGGGCSRGLIRHHAYHNNTIDKTHSFC